MKINDTVQIDESLRDHFSRIGVSDPAMLSLLDQKLVIVEMSSVAGSDGARCTVRDQTGREHDISLNYLSLA